MRWLSLLSRVFAIAFPIALIALTFLYPLRMRMNPARATVGVHADAFAAPTRAAMDIWNGYVGCEFLVKGKDVIVRSDDGVPCGDPWRPEAEWDHDATAYLCPGGVSEILVSRPGDVHQQACIIAHELGHVLGVAHGEGAMSSRCEDMIRIPDSISDLMRRRYCQ